MRPRPDLLAHLSHPAALGAALKAVVAARGAPGVDGVRPAHYLGDLRALERLGERLREGRYRPRPVLRRYIPKPWGGERAIGILCVEDRIVGRALQTCLRMGMGPLFCEGSFAYRPRRNAKGAVNRALGFLREGRPWVALMDIEDFFPSVDRGLLMAFLGQALGPEPVLAILQAHLEAPVLEGGVASVPPMGLEQGSPVSPYLSNVFLHPWDRAREHGGEAWVRYSDNALIACRSEGEARAALARSREDLARLGLRLKAEKSAVRCAEAGIPFLGHTLTPGGMGPERRAIEGLRARLDALDARDGGAPLEARIEGRRQLIAPWHAYYGTFRGVEAMDGVSLLAALEVARRRGDVRGARALLRAEVVGGMPSGELRRVLDGALRGLGLGGVDVHAPPRQGSPAPTAARGGDVEGDVDALLRGGAYRAAAAGLGRAAGAVDSAPRPTRAPVAAPAPEPLGALLPLLLARFGGGAFHGALTLGPDGKKVAERMRGGITPELLRAHLAGERTLAILTGVGGLSAVGALDVDVPCAPGALPDPSALARALAVAVALAHLARGDGLRPLITVSGRKGYHLYVFLDPPAQSAAIRRRLAALLQGVTLPAGVAVEIFPISTGARPGSGGMIALPFGRHPMTGAECHALDLRGRGPMEGVAALLASPPTALSEGATRREGRGGGETDALDPRILALLNGCPLLGRLVHKARGTGHLHHLERLALRQTFGLLGAEGDAFVHRVISLCDNYDPRITQGKLRQTRPSPVSCQRLKEWLGDPLRPTPCGCRMAVPAGAYPTPLLFALSAHPAD